MNTSQLKRFASSARRKLIEQVAARLEYVLTTDSAELRSKSQQLRELNELITNKGKIPTIEKVAYTWFNRLMALRFMDANSYTAIKVLTPAEGMLQPEVLEEAKRGHIEVGVKVNLELINNFLDGRTSSNNPQNEVYRHLLVAVCNSWHTAMPFLFERIDDYTELLMPDDLLSDNSIVTFIRLGMTDEDCQNVEIIGWLYQFYIAEKKDQVFASKSKVKAEDIPAATQLFTPRWIVEYMVQNTIGKLWLRNKPASSLKAEMPYYIESPAEKETPPLKISAPLELNLLDPACGSGHILVYGFDLLCKIYEEEGYSTSEIPYLILEHNLVGIDIDERAAQLSAFALVMKARAYYPRFFRKPVEPKITALKDFSLDEADTVRLFNEAGLSLNNDLKHDLNLMRQATNFGSLIIPQTGISDLKFFYESLAQSPLNGQFLWQVKVEELLISIKQLLILSEKHVAIVANPPYMTASNMNSSLNLYVKKRFPFGKPDFMTCFMERIELLLHEKGLYSMINLPSWMFLSSFENFRKSHLSKFKIESLLQLGRGIFGSDFGSVAFTMELTSSITGKGVYRRLFEKHVQVRSAEKIRSLYLDSSYNTFVVNQLDFLKIPGSQIGYWLSEQSLKNFDFDSIGDHFLPRFGMSAGDGDRFIRRWQEASFCDIGIKKDAETFNASEFYWAPYDKGGIFRRWFGNQENIVNWSNNGEEIRAHPKSAVRSPNLFFKSHISWTLVSSGDFSARYFDKGFILDTASNCIYFKNEIIDYNSLGFLNSVVARHYLNVLNPTLNFSCGVVEKLPYKRDSTASNVSELCVTISKADWDSNEASWNFQQNELLKHKTQTDLADAYDSYEQYWTTKFFQLHKNEEELNRIFINSYGLQEELNPEVPLKNITILQDELFRPQLEQIRLERNPETNLVQSYEGLQLPFNKAEVIKQFVSYAVGCMFGRYSLAKPGLILANAGQTIKDYNYIISEVVGDTTLSGVEGLSPDTDGIIPVLDDEYFHDDIVSKFNQFLKASFGEAAFEKNLHFIEDALGKDIRKYLTKDFYADHVKRYKKRPIYWMFSSPKKGFNVLIYLHRYSTDTVSLIRNQYLNPFMEKLKANKEHLVHIKNSASATPSEKTKADRRITEIEQLLIELANYEREIIYPLAVEQIALDLNDGVLVNYNKFSTALQEVKGLSGAVKVQKEQTEEIN